MLLLRNVAASCTDRRFVQFTGRCTVVSLKGILNEHPDAGVLTNEETENGDREGSNHRSSALQKQFGVNDVTRSDDSDSMKVHT